MGQYGGLPHMVEVTCTDKGGCVRVIFMCADCTDNICNFVLSFKVNLRLIAERKGTFKYTVVVNSDSYLNCMVQQELKVSWSLFILIVTVSFYRTVL